MYKGVEEGDEETWLRTQLVIKCTREETKYAEQLRCHAWEGNSKTTDVGIREIGV